MTAADGARALALDLGTTRIKLGELRANGELRVIGTRDSPRVAGAGLVRESDAARWLNAVRELLAGAGGGGMPLGLSSQRSSFLLWRRADGHPLTPLISWQDRRAQDWCDRHPHLEPVIARRAGLRLSPHYAGPKLASLLEQRPDWRGGLAGGETLFGTLDTWVAWSLSARREHVTDLSMAARTGLAPGCCAPSACRRPACRESSPRPARTLPWKAVRCCAPVSPTSLPVHWRCSVLRTGYW